MSPRNKPPGSSAPQTSDEIYTCTKSYGSKSEILIKLFLENVEIFHNCLKLPFFGLKIRLLFTDLFRILFRIQFWIRIRIRIRNVYFGSGSDPDPVKSFGSGSGSGSATLQYIQAVWGCGGWGCVELCV
jgi:hypothetical protein